MNRLEALIIFLGDAAPAVLVMGPADLDTAPPGGTVCTVELSGAGEEADPREFVTGYLLRFYGDDDLAILDSYEVLERATYADAPRRFRRCNVPVGTPEDPWTLRWARLGQPTGPTPEPDSDRRVLLATATAKWSR